MSKFKKDDTVIRTGATNPRLGLIKGNKYVVDYCENYTLYLIGRGLKYDVAGFELATTTEVNSMSDGWEDR